MRRCAAAVLVVLAFAGAHPAWVAAEGTEAVGYLPPVDAEVVDPFRAPATPYGEGNRGIDYATLAGQPVMAAAGGEVVFAGRVGRDLHVVVLHGDGIRTTYAFLAATSVRRGEIVRGGQQVGVAGSRPLHFGARAGDAYVDPLALLGQRPGRVHLVDDDDREPLAEAEERRRLLDVIRRAGRWAGDRAEEIGRWVAGQAGEFVHRKTHLALALTHELASLATPFPVRLAVAVMAWEAEQSACTPPSTPVTPPAERRIAVLVPGLWSTTERGGVLSVDTASLGYAGGDVHRFSYAADGGTYGRGDTEVDIDAAGRLLAAQVRRLQQIHPGVPVDVIAHSLGGLVARSAVTREGAVVAALVTLGTPHQGADLATAAAALDGTTSGHLLLEGASHLPGFPDGAGRSVGQMSEVSDYLRELPEGTWPPAMRVVSVAARGDIVVPNTRSRLAGAGNVVVTPSGGAGWDDHGRLPGSPEATREIARAIAGQRPSCRPFPDLLVDEVIAAHAGSVQDALGIALAAGGLAVDARLRAGVLGLR